MLNFMRPSLPLLPSLAKRLHPHVRGKMAEMLAHIVYGLHGYTPAPRPARALAQTDLLLRRRTTLLLVEVKYRASQAAAQTALTPAQTARLTRQARALAGRYPTATIRLEVLLVFPRYPFIQRAQCLDLP